MLHHVQPTTPPHPTVSQPPCCAAADHVLPLRPGRSAAGLQAVSCIVPQADVEDVDLLEAGLVAGHTDYPLEMRRILDFLRVT